jgi:hypothetical protein
MRCSDVERAMLDALDGELARDHMQEFQAHLAACETCRAEFSQLRSASGALREAVSELAPPTSYVTARRIEGVFGAYGRRRAPIKLLTWHRFAAAAAVAAILASAPFIISDVISLVGPGTPVAGDGWGSSSLSATRMPPFGGRALMLTSTDARPSGRSVVWLPLHAGPPAGRGARGETPVVRTDSEGVTVPVRHVFYDAEESSRWW